MTLTTYLITMMCLSSAYGVVICNYQGTVAGESYLEEASCDIMTYDNFKPSSNGVFELKATWDHPNALQALPLFHCKRPIYLEYTVCNDNQYKTLGFTSVDLHKKSLESVMEYAKHSGYDGFILTLCDLDSQEYLDLQSVILTTVKSKSSSLQMKYIIRVFNYNQGFIEYDHIDTAEYISVAYKMLETGFSFSWDEYNITLNVTDITDHWTRRGWTKSKLLFDLKVHVTSGYNTGSTVRLFSPAPRCKNGDASMKTNVLNEIQTITSNIADKVKETKIAGVYVHALSSDDYFQICGSVKFPFVKAIKTKLV